MDTVDGPATKLIRVDHGVLKDIEAWWKARTSDGVYEQTSFCRGLSWRQRVGWTGKLMLLCQECKRVEGVLAKRKARAAVKE